MIFEYTSKDFDTDHIFDCGQCFRWEREDDGSYTGIVAKRIANISYVKKEKKVLVDESDKTTDKKSEEFWRNYLDLDRDYGKIKRELAKRDQVIQEAIKFGKGIRILKQEPWEALISFIISSNNNIPRIKKNIDCISKNHGTRAGKFRGETYYNLPSPRKLAKLTPDDLAECKLGYRADYIIKTAKMVTEDKGKVYKEKLLDYCGVGPKVANCISLFSMEGYDSFPIDTWVEQVMKKLYGIEKKKDIEKFARDTFGDEGGFAQQYLFYYVRSKG